jgi:aldose sugar dehydrogenase
VLGGVGGGDAPDVAAGAAQAEGVEQGGQLGQAADPAVAVAGELDLAEAHGRQAAEDLGEALGLDAAAHRVELDADPLARQQRADVDRTGAGAAVLGGRGGALGGGHRGGLQGGRADHRRTHRHQAPPADRRALLCHAVLRGRAAHIRRARPPRSPSEGPPPAGFGRWRNFLAVRGRTAGVAGRRIQVPPAARGGWTHVTGAVVRMRTALLALLAALAVVAPLGGAASAQQVGIDPAVEREVLFDQLLTPTGLAVADDGRVVVIHREGRITVWEQDGTVTDAARLPVDAYDRQGGQFDEDACPRGEECPAGYNLAEGGIHGILLAPDFLESGELYLYYSPPDTLGEPVDPPKMPGARQSSRGSQPDEGLFRLSRFTMDLETNTIDLSTELELFENPAEWFECCHYGGDLAWRNDGTLLLSTGDDTSSDESGGYSPHDTRADKRYNSAVLTSQNLADRRGKILRIDVADIEAGGDGVPGVGEDPNPFAEEPGADPYVYALGFRSNYRFAYDAETDHIYVGNVGPDARQPNPSRGPAVHDEIEVVPPGGGTNHGWPYCIADNIPYNRYDFETGTSGPPFSCAGMTPATLSYAPNPSPTTNTNVQMGSGSNTALGGVSYRRPDTGALRLPAAYDDQFLWMEHGRGQLWRMPIKADGTLDDSTTTLLPVATGGIPILPNTLRNPIDAAIGPDGAVYMIEGNGFWNSTRGILSRITCAGCSPDPSDYGDDVTVAPRPEQVAVASVDGGVSGALPAAGAAALAAAGLAVAGLRRRRAVV